MDTAVVTAASAILGSLVGGSASLATAYISQRTQARRAAIQEEMRKREVLYTDYIAECSKLALDSMEHTLETPETLRSAYTLVSRIRLVASDAVLQAAEAALEEIFESYRAPNLPPEKFRALTSLKSVHDPLRAFSEACRRELQALKRDDPAGSIRGV
jgi:tyrosyl-tRNA synthetase